MAKVQKQFEFQTPLTIEKYVFNRISGKTVVDPSKAEFLGNITIKGVAYPPTEEEPISFDIDDVLLDNGTSVYDLLRWLGGGDVKEIDQIFNASVEHYKWLMQPHEEDRYTDLQQDELKQRRA